jgi:pentalenolactone synthase
VPFADQENFRAWADGALHMHDPSHARESFEGLGSYMGALIDEKRLRPGDDMISDMVAAAGEGRLFERQVTQLVVAFFLAGHETTVARLDFGMLFLLTFDDQRRALQENPALIAQVVEEVLRMAVPGPGLMPRYATADIDIDGTTITAGDLVLLGNGAANRDPSAFVDPDRFDATRESNQHVAFGYGPRFCLGAGLARVELNCALARLFARFTELRLGVPVEDLRLRDDVFTGGLVSLPVVW